MKSFTNKVAAITGAGSGIGRQLAVQLVAAGAEVALCDVDEPGLATTAARCRELGVRRVGQARVDVADRTAVHAKTILAGVLRNRRRVLIGPDARVIDLLQRSLPSAYQRISTAIARRQLKAAMRGP